MKKDRHISIPDFLETLQKEYFLVLLRSKIYHSPKDKAYYKKVANYKKEKIINLGLKYQLSTIFEDDKLYMSYKIMIFGITVPNFFYINDIDRETKELSDETNYYLKGSDVKVFLDDKNLIGKIYFYNFLSKEVSVIDKVGDINIYNKEKINRIL